jgi:hypothetical protein
MNSTPRFSLGIKSFFLLLIVSLLGSMVSLNAAQAQGPGGKSFGFGLILGEPLGGTIKVWTNPTNAFVADIGESYFGSPRLQADYLWHFDPFHSRIVRMYAGPGLAIGFNIGNGGAFNEGNDRFEGDAGVGVRAIFGLNIVPVATPLEIFVEAGPLIAFAPGFGAGFDAAVGIRFYP